MMARGPNSEMARKRGAKILAEILGFACTNNGGDLIHPDIEGIKQTLRMTLKDANLHPEQIDFISAHATGTKMGDVIEAEAIRSIYGESPYVTALKGYMGHTMGSCGVIETILCIYMMEEGIIAPTLNLEEVDGRCDIIRHTMELREKPVKTSAIQNFAFGGVNTCLFIRKYE